MYIIYCIILPWMWNIRVCYICCFLQEHFNFDFQFLQNFSVLYTLIQCKSHHRLYVCVLEHCSLYLIKYNEIFLLLCFQAVCYLQYFVFFSHCNAVFLLQVACSQEASSLISYISSINIVKRQKWFCFEMPCLPDSLFW